MRAATKVRTTILMSKLGLDVPGLELDIGLAQHSDERPGDIGGRIQYVRECLRRGRFALQRSPKDDVCQYARRTGSRHRRVDQASAAVWPDGIGFPEAGLQSGLGSESNASVSRPQGSTLAPGRSPAPKFVDSDPSLRICRRMRQIFHKQAIARQVRPVQPIRSPARIPAPPIGTQPPSSPPGPRNGRPS